MSDIVKDAIIVFTRVKLKLVHPTYEFLILNSTWRQRKLRARCGVEITAEIAAGGGEEEEGAITNMVRRITDQRGIRG